MRGLESIIYSPYGVGGATCWGAVCGWKGVCVCVKTKNFPWCLKVEFTAAGWTHTFYDCYSCDRWPAEFSVWRWRSSDALSELWLPGNGFFLSLEITSFFFLLFLLFAQTALLSGDISFFSFVEKWFVLPVCHPGTAGTFCTGSVISLRMTLKQS